MADGVRVDLAHAAHRVWYGDDSRARFARAALSPFALAFDAITRARNALYSAHVLAQHRAVLPVLAIGNVTVGGTGKTPIAAWFATRLRDAGATPAIVMRGYGDDEPRVHALLTPGIAVIANANRIEGVDEARRRGADVAVLDDAFQHRRVWRDADVALVSAEHMHRAPRLLPAGPYRESFDALRRASVVMITRKSLAAHDAAAAADALYRMLGGVPVAVVALALDALRPVGEITMSAVDAPRTDARSGEPLDALARRRVLAIAAIGEPDAFFAQLEAAGALVDRAPYRDHHAFDPADVARLARRAEGVDRVVCTLKDAVKLGPLWPRLASPLWYVSQRVAVERGSDVLDDLIARVLDARARHHETTGSRRPS